MGLRGPQTSLPVDEIRELVGAQRLSHREVAERLGLTKRQVDQVCTRFKIFNRMVGNGRVRVEVELLDVLREDVSQSPLGELRQEHTIASRKYQDALLVCIRAYSPDRGW